MEKRPTVTWLKFTQHTLNGSSGSNNEAGASWTRILQPLTRARISALFASAPLRPKNWRAKITGQMLAGAAIATLVLYLVSGRIVPQAARGLTGGAVGYVLRRAFGLYGAVRLHPLNQPIHLSLYVESSDQEESR